MLYRRWIKYKRTRLVTINVPVCIYFVYCMSTISFDAKIMLVLLLNLLLKELIIISFCKYFYQRRNSMTHYIILLCNNQPLKINSTKKLTLKKTKTPF